jgi:FtsH-binding integral membrane protein
VIVFPLISSIVAALCAAVMARDAWRRPRPDKVIWTIAFSLFALAAGIEVVGSRAGWTELLARTYYATGVALVVVFLAAGQMFLLFPRQMRMFGFAVTLLVTALWVSLVFGAPIDATRLSHDGWDAIERGPELVALGITLNAVGTALIVGGSAWSVYRFRKSGRQRQRMYGCLLILGGTLVVASGGSLERLGSDQYLYIAMALGVSIIFAGVLVARRPDVPASASASSTDDIPRSDVRGDQRSGEAIAVTHPVGSIETVPLAAEAVAFIETLLIRSADEVSASCAEWSVPREDAESLSRTDARRAWRLRSRLSPAAIARFDAHSVAVRRQVATLYFDVLTWERAGREDITELVTPSENGGLRRRSDQG